MEKYSTINQYSFSLKTFSYVLEGLDKLESWYRYDPISNRIKVFKNDEKANTFCKLFGYEVKEEA